jgi:NAD(P)H-flavin reductase
MKDTVVGQSAEESAWANAVTDPMTPVPFRVISRTQELADTFSLQLEPAAVMDGFTFTPGQFNMLYRFGVGEVPISISGDPGDPGTLTHTIRSVGAVTDALKGLEPGHSVGVRGPFGSGWPVDEAEGYDVVILAGGVGLAPLRPVIYHLLANRERYGCICVYYGARSPEDILFREQLERWRGRFDINLDVTVDRAAPEWRGKVGVVTKLIGRQGFDPVDTLAFVCGPEIMMRYGIMSLNDLGVDNQHIYLSMERNMKCAVGFCGHCQFGTAFVCRDGPVFRYDRIAERFNIREL